MTDAERAGRSLSLRELNRATLARQLLLPDGRRPPSGPAARRALILATLEQVAGLQAQASRAGYVGLWARIPGFARDDLTDLLHRRLVVKATLMRGTIHLVTADDYLRLRPAMQPLLTRLARRLVERSGADVSFDDLKAEADGFFAEPRPLKDLRALLERRHKGANIERLAYALRVGLALIHAPRTGATWGFPAQPLLVDADAWLGQPVSGAAEPGELIRRYLAAFGPASLADIQTWSGLGGLRFALKALRPELAVYRAPAGEELFDVPEPAVGALSAAAPAAGAIGPLPPIFVPEWDSVLLAHDDRRRIVPAEFREPVYQRLRQLIGPCALLDGFAAAVWRIERPASLAIAPFRELTPNEREALALTGERLARFMLPAAASPAVTFTSL